MASCSCRRRSSARRGSRSGTAGSASRLAAPRPSALLLQRRSINPINPPGCPCSTWCVGRGWGPGRWAGRVLLGGARPVSLVHGDAEAPGADSRAQRGPVGGPTHEGGEWTRPRAGWGEADGTAATSWAPGPRADGARVSLRWGWRGVGSERGIVVQPDWVGPEGLGLRGCHPL